MSASDRTPDPEPGDDTVDDAESDAFDATATGSADPTDGDDSPDADAPGSDESEWRFGLDEVGPEAESVPEPIEPGSPTLENALFVLVGVVATLLLLSTVL